jgi:hypothetical protein
MCYSAETSIESFLVNQISGWILFFTFDKFLALYTMYIGLIQVYEYIFWTNQTKNAWNYWTTKLAMLTVNFQPIVLAAGIVYMNQLTLNIVCKIVLSVYVTFCVLFSIYSWFQIDYTLVTKETAPGLFWQWTWLPGSIFFYPLYTTTFVCLFLYNFPYPLNLLLCGIILFGFIFNFLKYMITSARMWCYIASFSPIYIIAYYLMLKYRPIRALTGIELVNP